MTNAYVDAAHLAKVVLTRFASAAETPSRSSALSGKKPPDAAHTLGAELCSPVVLLEGVIHIVYLGLPSRGLSFFPHIY